MNHLYASTTTTRDEGKVRYARSILRPWPWPRALAQVLTLAVVVGMWWWGAHDAPPLGLTAKLAIGPLAVMLIINDRWQRAEERRSKAARTPDPH